MYVFYVFLYELSVNVLYAIFITKILYTKTVFQDRYVQKNI